MEKASTSTWDAYFSARAAERRDAGLARALREFTPMPCGRARVGGREVINLASNDYLGLAADPELLLPYLKEEGLPFGAGASRLISGTHVIHAKLEAAIAAVRGYEAALYLPSGYQANLAAIQGLADAETAVFSDALNHASLIDGCRLARAQVQVFAHRDYASLEAMLAEAGEQRKMIVSDSLFSMDGDFADLRKLAALSAKFDALLLVDDAHGFATVGANGGGVPEVQGLRPNQISVVTGTFSKTLGGLGGYVCGSRALIDHLINVARPFIFSTGASPMQCAASLAALRWSESKEANAARIKLGRLATLMRDGLLKLGCETGGDSQIVPLWLGEPQRAVEVSAALFEQGVLAPAIRPPTVPQGRAMIRFSLSAALSGEDVMRVLKAVGEAL